jgi:hypothetical protein
VAVEVDGDPVGADHEAVELAVAEVVEHECALREHLAAEDDARNGRRADRPLVAGGRWVGVERLVDRADLEQVRVCLHAQAGELVRRLALDPRAFVEPALERRARVVRREGE